MKKLGYLLLLVLIAQLAVGQNNWRIYNTTNSGLSEDDLRTLNIDSVGTIWAGTWSGGLCSFDGNNWTTYTAQNSGLPDDFIKHIEIDSNNHKWIGTWGGGIAKFDGVNWTTYNNANSGLKSNFIQSMTISSNQEKWIGYNDAGLQRFDGTTWITDTGYSVSSSQYVYATAVSQANNGDIWVGSRAGEVAVYNGNFWSVYVPPTPAGFSWVEAIGEAPNGDIWVGTWGQGLVQFNAPTWNYFTPSNSGQPSMTINSITFDANQNMWLGTFNGLVIYDGSNWTVYDTSNSVLPHNNVSMVKFDDYDNAWLATDEGLVTFNPNGIVTSVAETPNITTSISVFPNPAQDVVSVTSQGKSIESVQIMDLKGQLIKTIRSDFQSIPTADLAAGNYLLKILVDGHISTERLVVQ